MKVLWIILYFQYCQKLVVLTKIIQKCSLLEERRSRLRWSVFLIGGKMETTDHDLKAGIKRVTEEIGSDARLEGNTRLFFQ